MKHDITTWVVTRETRHAFLGVHGWVQAVEEAAHFVSKRSANSAADVERESNVGVEVVGVVHHSDDETDDDT